MDRRARETTELIHEGKYAAEVPILLTYSDESWSPTMSLDDARKLETVRLALPHATPTAASRLTGEAGPLAQRAADATAINRAIDIASNMDQRIYEFQRKWV